MSRFLLLTYPTFYNWSKRTLEPVTVSLTILRQIGVTAQVCFDLLQNRKEAIAVKVFSMTVLANIAKDQPALKSELKIIIEDNMPFGSAGFVSRGQKILKELKD